MDALLILQTVTSHHDLKGLCHLYGSVESHVRGLRTLVDAGSCGQLLSSILINKLPTEMHFIVSCELGDSSGMLRSTVLSSVFWFVVLF